MSAVRLFAILPAILKSAWALLVLGMIALAAGYFSHIPWLSYLALGCLISGYTIVIIDMIYRRKHRGRAAGFYAASTVAPIVALFVIVFVALIGAIVLAVQSALYGYSKAHALHLLHFLGIIFAFLVISLISGLALQGNPTVEAEANEDEAAASQGPKL